MNCPVLSALSGLSAIQGRIVIGCSGGRDSLSLAFGCYLLYQAGKLPTLPTLIHINHGIQPANDDWANFVRAWADEHGFDCQVVALGLGRANESQARQARYHAMSGLINNDDVLLTAHHQDDQAETVLMRLINGAGVQGLAGMRAWQTLQMGDKTLTIHRPLLGVSRADITAFAHAHELSYVDDPTNETSDNARSFIRNDILPRLATLNPKVADNIAKTATLMDETHTLLHETVLECFGGMLIATSHTPFVSMLDVAKLTALSRPMQSAVVRYWLQGNEPLPPNAQITSDIIALAHRTDTDHQTEIFWRTGGGFFICRYQNRLYRYHHELFLLLNAKTDDTPIVPQGEWVILKALPKPINHTVRPELVEGQHHRGLTGSPRTVLFDESLVLAWHYHQVWQELFFDKQVSIRPIGKTSVRVAVLYQDKTGQTLQGFDKLSGKKLYQKLHIPTWYRQNLWGVSVDGELVLMIGVDRWWVLQSGWFDRLWAMRQVLGQSLCVVRERGTKTDECFAQMGELG